jgi:hypothetical protein
MLLLTLVLGWMSYTLYDGGKPGAPEFPREESLLPTEIKVLTPVGVNADVIANFSEHQIGGISWSLRLLFRGDTGASFYAAVVTTQGLAEVVFSDTSGLKFFYSWLWPASALHLVPPYPMVSSSGSLRRGRVHVFHVIKERNSIPVKDLGATSAGVGTMTRSPRFS